MPFQTSGPSKEERDEHKDEIIDCYLNRNMKIAKIWETMEEHGFKAT